MPKFLIHPDDFGKGKDSLSSHRVYPVRDPFSGPHFESYDKCPESPGNKEESV